MRFFPLLGLAGLAIGAAIDRAEPGDAAPQITANHVATPVPCLRRDAAGRCQGAKELFAKATSKSSDLFSGVPVPISSHKLSGGPFPLPTFHTEDTAAAYTSNEMGGPPPNGQWKARFATADVNKRGESTSTMTSCSSGYASVSIITTDYECHSFYDGSPMGGKSCWSNGVHPTISCSAIGCKDGEILRPTPSSDGSCTTTATPYYPSWRQVAAFATTTTPPGYSPTRSNTGSSSTSSPPWSNTLPPHSIPPWTSTRSNTYTISNSPIPSTESTMANENVARAVPTCSFNVGNGHYDCPTLTQAAAPVPTCTFDPAKGQYICTKPPTCYFDVDKGQYICPTPAAAADGAALPVPVCFFDRAKGHYVCNKPPTCYFDPQKGEYVCPKPSKIEARGPVPTCYFGREKGRYVCAKPPLCYFDPQKGEYICIKPAANGDGKS